jgi:hypothetical protein
MLYTLRINFAVLGKVKMRKFSILQEKRSIRKKTCCKMFPGYSIQAITMLC